MIRETDLDNTPPCFWGVMKVFFDGRIYTHQGQTHMSVLNDVLNNRSIANYKDFEKNLEWFKMYHPCRDTWIVRFPERREEIVIPMNTDYDIPHDHESLWRYIIDTSNEIYYIDWAVHIQNILSSKISPYYPHYYLNIMELCGCNLKEIANEVVPLLDQALFDEIKKCNNYSKIANIICCLDFFMSIGYEYDIVKLEEHVNYILKNCEFMDDFYYARNVIETISEKINDKIAKQYEPGGEMYNKAKDRFEKMSKDAQ